MPNHETPCPEIGTMKTDIAVLNKTLEDHISFDKQFQRESKERHDATDKKLNEMSIEIAKLPGEVKNIFKDGMKAHESVEATHGMAAAEKTVTAMDKMRETMEHMKTDRASTERKVLLWVIGIMSTGVTAMLVHIVKGG